jgi:hypothetical protein
MNALGLANSLKGLYMTYSHPRIASAITMLRSLHAENEELKEHIRYLESLNYGGSSK